VQCVFAKRKARQGFRVPGSGFQVPGKPDKLDKLNSLNPLNILNGYHTEVLQEKTEFHKGKISVKLFFNSINSVVKDIVACVQRFSAKFQQFQRETKQAEGTRELLLCGRKISVSKSVVSFFWLSSTVYLYSLINSLVNSKISKK